MSIAALLATLHTAPHTAVQEDEAFYAPYGWCLNPILSLGGLFQRLNEELERAPELTAAWQRAECRINLYLFVCAIACTVDDYLGRRPADLSPISAHFPKARFAVKLAERLLEAGQTLRRATAGRSVALWRRQWIPCVDAACEMLVHEAEPGDRRWVDFETRVRAASQSPLPQRFLRQRMTLPAAFRNQDLTHHDLAVLAGRFMASCADTERPLVVVVGLRTAGAYFAPLVKAHLSALGVPRAEWLTIRPKEGLSSEERSRLRTMQDRNAHVLLVDEPPNSGKTFQLTLGILKRYGIPPDRIAFAAPRNPAKADWIPPPVPPGEPSARLITLDPQQFYKTQLLDQGALTPLLREYCGPEAQLAENRETAELNERLRMHHQAGFHVRIKRVFELRVGQEKGDIAPTRVLAKSVGWGWLGYHAYIAGTRLAGMVPSVIGLRQGLLFTEWVGGVDDQRRLAAREIDPRAISSYVATRANRLRLAEDPCFENLGYGWTGWREIVDLLRRAYGFYVGRLKIPTLHRALRRYVSPMPALIDGRMEPEEWVTNGGGLLKADFEHHAFGKTELNIVDPAYDLAGAVFGLQLSAAAERQLLEGYAHESGDVAVGERILLYKLLHGVLATKNALVKVASESSRDAQDAWNRRYLTARGFLTEQLTRFAASRIPTAPFKAWSKRLVFLDLDGVLDTEVFGFPHTTSSGLAALDLLRSHRFSVVLNTGRSVEDVHTYCREYSLPGGVAEFGSVFLDAVAGREVPLITDQAAEQLADCRQAISTLPGVFLDPFYRYSLRAYRFKPHGTIPLPPAEVEDVLVRHKLDRLAASPSPIDTIILQQGTDKGEGLRAVKRHLGVDGHPVAAIGDSDRDLPMLRAAEFAYVPAGCSPSLRALGRVGGCRVMSEGSQRGLLAAVQDLTRRVRGSTPERRPRPPRRANRSDLLETLLYVAERPRLRQFLSTLTWWSL